MLIIRAFNLLTAKVLFLSWKYGFGWQIQSRHWPMMEDNDDALLWSRFSCMSWHLTGLLVFRTVVSYFGKGTSSWVLSCSIFPSDSFSWPKYFQKTLTFGDFIVSVLFQFILFSLSSFAFCMCSMKKINFSCSHKSLLSPEHTLPDNYFLFSLLCPASAWMINKEDLTWDQVTKAVWPASHTVI